MAPAGIGDRVEGLHAVTAALSAGRVSSISLRFLSPMEPGLREIFSHFDRVMTIEINYSDAADDPYIDEDNRRYAELASLLRGQTLVDIDCWSRVPGVPLPPGAIVAELRRRLQRTGE